MYSYIFDIGGVLINYDSEALAKKLAEANGCDREAVYGLFSHDLLYQVETGRLSCEDFFNGHVCGVLPGLSYEDWTNAFAGHYTLNPAAFELLLELKQKGRKVYILSNLAEFHKIAIERALPEFFSYCDHNFFSYEMGYHKPEREIFQSLCSAIGEVPERCVFLDDIPENIEGARNAGLIGFVYSNGEIDRIREGILQLEGK